ncbi:GPW/gp25 family protein [Microbacterium ureisolvens]|uniref:GPW/gp25 family protein n=1 Tax=Microbacterium ureisolvens TaxID=2781186 RepID=UPI0036422769
MDVSFPYQLNPQGRTATASPDAHVRDLIEQLLFTVPGERVMRPTLGSGLAQLVFQPGSDDLATAVELLAQGTLQQFLGELIVVEAVQVASTESTLEVTVQYVLRRTQVRQVEQFARQV